MTAPDIAAIAKGLTKAQREAVKAAWFKPYVSEWRVSGLGKVVPNLAKSGLVTGMWNALTPLGIAVREHLQREAG